MQQNALLINIIKSGNRESVIGGLRIVQRTSSLTNALSDINLYENTVHACVSNLPVKEGGGKKGIQKKKKKNKKRKKQKKNKEMERIFWYLVATLIGFGILTGISVYYFGYANQEPERGHLVQDEMIPHPIQEMTKYHTRINDTCYSMLRVKVCGLKFQ